MKRPPSRPLPDVERHHLMGGPYRPPPFRIGSLLACEFRGTLPVIGWSSAPIPWPMIGGRGLGRPGLVVCGDLVRALRTESVAAICYWWGVGGTTVKRWKRDLGIGRSPGSERLYSIIRDDLRTNEHVRELRRQKAPTNDPVRRAKLRAGARKPKSPEHRRKLSESRRAFRLRPAPNS